MLRSYKYRLYPTREQAEKINKTFGAVRFVYNQLLIDRARYYRDTGKRQQIRLGEYKKRHTFLYAVDSTALSWAVWALERAYTNFFKRPDAGPPKCKRKKELVQSYTSSCINGSIRLAGGFIRLPKLKDVKIKLHRPLPAGAVIKNATISKAENKYYICICFECESQAPEQVQVNKSVHVELCSAGVVTDAGLINFPSTYKNSMARAARLRERAHNMQDGSRNQGKIYRRLWILRLKIIRQRSDFWHKAALNLARNFDQVVLKKAGQGQGVSDFSFILNYKLVDRGKRLILA